MPMQLTVTGNDGLELAVQIHNFVAALQNPQAFMAGAQANATMRTNANAAVQQDTLLAQGKEEKPEEPKKAKKAAAPKEEAKAETAASKHTLQEVMDITKQAIIDSGDEAAGKLRAEKINKSFGISRVRELPPEKLDAYVEAINAEFPAKEQAGMFD